MGRRISGRQNQNNTSWPGPRPPRPMSGISTSLPLMASVLAARSRALRQITLPAAACLPPIWRRRLGPGCQEPWSNSTSRGRELIVAALRCRSMTVTALSEARIRTFHQAYSRATSHAPKARTSTEGATAPSLTGQATRPIRFTGLCRFRTSNRQPSAGATGSTIWAGTRATRSSVRRKVPNSPTIRDTLCSSLEWTRIRQRCLSSFPTPTLPLSSSSKYYKASAPLIEPLERDPARMDLAAATLLNEMQGTGAGTDDERMALAETVLNRFAARGWEDFLSGTNSPANPPGTPGAYYAGARPYSSSVAGSGTQHSRRE